MTHRLIVTVAVMLGLAGSLMAQPQTPAVGSQPQAQPSAATPEKKADKKVEKKVVKKVAKKSKKVKKEGKKQEAAPAPATPQ